MADRGTSHRVSMGMCACFAEETSLTTANLYHHPPKIPVSLEVQTKLPWALSPEKQHTLTCYVRHTPSGMAARKLHNLMETVMTQGPFGEGRWTGKHLVP